MKATMRGVLVVALTVGSLQWAAADSGVQSATQANRAFAKYGLTGRGVIIAILDRGIDYTHPDFRHADGTTRIKMMWDMSAQNLCSAGNPAPVVYTEAAINAALLTGTPLAERDAVGHGTVTAGIAAGNGSAVPPYSQQFAGLAPDADLLIVKVTSEGAPAHGDQPLEDPFEGCFSQALDLVSAEALALGEPIVALINSGTQWGPIDGTSAVSVKIDEDFGSATPGYVYVEAAGDEGALPNHARAGYGAPTPAMIPLQKSAADPVNFQAWYTGSAPAVVTLTMADDLATVTLEAGAANACRRSADRSLKLCQYAPGEQFYPWTSVGPDRAVLIEIAGHPGAAGTLQIAPQVATHAEAGTVDVYGDNAAIVSFPSDLTPGRLSDNASTLSAIVAGCYNVRTSWIDIDNQSESETTQGPTGGLWVGSAGGPTRDGRVPPAGGVDIVAPGGNIFAAFGLETYWETDSSRLIQGGMGYYGRQSATSGASPILQGTVALLLQMSPRLTAAEIRQVIHQSAITDAFTGSTPNPTWGAGKLNVLGAADLVAARFNTHPALSASAITFPTTTVGETSATRKVSFSNEGGATDALGIASVAVSGDFVLARSTCGTSLPAEGHCTITLAFKPTAKGTRRGTLTLKDFNVRSPHTVALTGRGS
jgi:minor extracellular serine protease Vpr